VTLTYTKNSSYAITGEEATCVRIETLPPVNGSTVDYTSLAALAADLNGKLLSSDLTVTLASDNAEPVTFENIFGSTLTINGNGKTSLSPIHFKNCYSMINIRDMNYTLSSSAPVTYIDNCNYVGM